MAADPFETLTPEEQAALVQLARERAGTAEEYEQASPRVERRDVLEALAAVGIGAAAGGGAVAGLAGPAEATSHGTGEIGTTANPLSDVHTGSIDGGGTDIGVGDGLIPDAASTHDLGSSSNPWSALFTDSLDVDGDTGIGFPSTSSSISPGFDSWTQVDADRPTIVILNIRVETNGSSNGTVRVQVDESGGTTADYQLEILADDALGAGSNVAQSYQLPLPAGAQFRIENTSDPAGDNTVLVSRAFTL